MITVVSIKNPFQPESNIKDLFEYREEMLLSDYLANFDLNQEGINFVIGVNGSVVENLKIKLNDGDIVAITANIEASMVATAAINAIIGIGGTYGIGTMAVWGAVYLATSFVIGYGLSMLATALGPDVDTTGGGVTSYGWDSLSQTTGGGNTLPLLFGTNRVAGQVINTFISVSGNKETLNTLLGVCDHAVDEITDIWINNQESSYYVDAEIETKNGYNNDTVIEGFDEVVTQTDVGTKMALEPDWTSQSTTGNAVEKIYVQVTAPNGIYYQDPDGLRSGVRATFNIEYRVWTDGDTNPWIYAGANIMYGSTETVRKVITLDNLAPNKYEVRLTKTNYEITDLAGNNDLYFAFLQEVVKEALTYPGTAKYAVKVLATDQLSGGTPSYSALVSKNTVTVWNPDANSGTGAWDSTKRATNPAWICYSLLNTYAFVDKDKIIWDDFKDWADYCDEEIEVGEYRFDINVVLSSGNFWTQIQKIARMGRATVLRRGTRYGVFVDKYEGVDPLVSHMFSMGNIIDGTYSLQYLSQIDRANAIDIEYTDVDKDYTRQIITVYSDAYLTGDGEEQRASYSMECSTTQDLAVREGVFRINSNKYTNRVVTFNAFTDSFAATVGDLFYFQHAIPNYETGVSGRILEAGNDYGGTNDLPYIVIDQEIDMTDGTSYSILIRLADGSFAEKIVVKTYIPVYGEDWEGYTELWGTRYEENWNDIQAGSMILILDSAFTTIPEQYDVYSMGETDVYKKIYRLTAITRQDDMVRTITGCEYVEQIYSDNDAYVIEEPDWLPVKATAIQVNIHEYLSYESDGSYKSNLNISWVRAYSQESANWTVWLKNVTDDTDPINIGDSFKNAMLYTGDVNVGHEYKVYVAAFNEGATDTGDNTSTITIQGKLAPPSDVLNFNGSWDSIKRQVIFTWSDIDDIDLKCYQIRQGDDFYASDIIIGKPTDNTLSIFIDEGVVEDITYGIRAIDTSGVFSTNATFTTVDINTSDTPLSTPINLVLTSDSEITSDGTNAVSLTAVWAPGAQSDDFHHYGLEFEEIATGATSQYATTNTQYRWEVLPVTQYRVSVTAVDVSGNNSGWITDTITTSKDYDAPVVVGDLTAAGTWSQIILTWNHGNEPDLHHFLVFRSLSTSSSSSVQIASAVKTFGAFVSMYADTPDSDDYFYYWVKGVDSSGNVSDFSNRAVAKAPGVFLSEGYITGVTIDDDAITAPKIHANAIDAIHINGKIIGADQIVAGEITGTEISGTTLSGIFVNAGTLTAGRLQNLANTTYFDLDANTFHLGDRLIWNGNTLSVKGAIEINSNSSGIGNFTDGGALALEDLIGTSLLDSTVITGNRITTGLVTADTIGANEIIANSANIKELTVNTLHVADNAITSHLLVSNPSNNQATVTLNVLNVPAEIYITATWANQYSCTTGIYEYFGGTWLTKREQYADAVSSSCMTYSRTCTTTGNKIFKIESANAGNRQATIMAMCLYK